MADLRPFPPSQRRRALARIAGIHAASPLLVGGVACAAALVAIAMAGEAAVSRVGVWIAKSVHGDSPLPPGRLAVAVLELAAPLLAAAAIVAIVAHFAQTRSLWIPRRRVAGAPSIPPARTRRAAFDLTAAAILGVVTVGWLWLLAPRIAALSSVPLAGALLVTSALAAFAIAWIAIGICDALLRHRDLAASLYMTAREKREDERLSGADPRWRAARARAARPLDPQTAVPGSTLLLLGDDVAVAIAWDPIRRPIPTRTATGRRARATQLLALARRHALPIHRDHALATALAVDTGPVHERHWPRLAEIVAAIRR